MSALPVPQAVIVAMIAIVLGAVFAIFVLRLALLKLEARGTFPSVSCIRCRCYLMPLVMSRWLHRE